MTPRSSIFSFETLRIRPPLSKALLLALTLLIVAELSARAAVRSGRLELDVSAKRLMDGYYRQIVNERPDVWLLGNSTLAWGVDEKQLQAAGTTRIVKLPHGSATANASASLLRYYLEQAPKPPKRVVLFLNKDDLNLKGLRAEFSQEYDTFINRSTEPAGAPIGRTVSMRAACRKFFSNFSMPQEHLVLWQAKGNITAKSSGLGKQTLQWLARKGSLTGEDHFNGKIDDDDPGCLALIRNYQLDRAAIGRFAAAAHAHGVTDVVVVMVPTTDVYVRFHDKRVPAATYDQIRAELAQLCAADGVRFYDDWARPSAHYADFRDGYHLNDAGRRRFTEALAKSGGIAQ